MKRDSLQIGKICQPTRTCDPRRNPDKSFFYVDISSIDRDQKTITDTSEITGAEAPSRARKIIRSGDILVSTVRPNLNAVAIVPADLDSQIASTGFCVLRPKPEVIDSKYLFYYSLTASFVDTLSAKVRGAHYPAVSDRDVKEIELPLPTISEQRRIVEILDQADALRKKRAEADAMADRILPALFYKMFGDPATNPKGWPLITGEMIFSKIGYGVGSPPPFSDEGVPFLRAGNIKPGGIKQENIVFFKARHKASIARSEVHTGDVVIVRRGAYTGDCAVIPEEFDGAFVGYDLICWPSSDTNPHWFAAAWNYPTIWQRIENIRKRAAQQGLNKQQIATFELPRPPKPLQDKFAQNVTFLMALNNYRHKANFRMEELFAVLLHRAFTGDLTANWREAHMKELLAEMELQAKLLDRESKSKSKRTESIIEQNIGNKATLTVSLKQEKDKNFEQIHG